MEDGWRSPVLKTSASRGEGVEELTEMIADHRAHLVETGRLEERRRRRTTAKTRRLVEDKISRTLWTSARNEQAETELAGGESPYTLSQLLIEEFYKEIRREQ